MDVLALLVRLIGVFWLDPEGMCAEVITLCLQQIGRKVLCAVSVVETESGAESGSGDAPESALGDNADQVLVQFIDTGQAGTHSLHPDCAL